MSRTAYSLPRKIFATAGGLAGIIALGLGLWQHPLTPEQWLYTLVLSLLGLLLGAIGAVIPGRMVLGLEGTSYYAAILTLGPWAAGLVALFPPFTQYRRDATMSPWALFRNVGMYALMGIAGGLAYDLIGAERPLTALTGQNLLGLLVALLVVRVVNDTYIFWSNALIIGVSRALRVQVEILVMSWGVEALAYFPALLTALIYARIGWAGLLIWLALFTATAVLLYQLVRSRGEVSRQLAELSEANARMREHNRLEAEMAGRLSQAAEELTGYASRLAAALHQQHAAVTEITSTVEELAQQARYIADAAGAVDSTSEAALVTASHGREAAAGSTQAMTALERHVQEMHERMGVLEGRSRLIRRALQTINNIADETHLLALNATIEAAGAGGQGRRFSVVAQQINALADQALRAAGDIQGTVREIEAATADTKQVIEQGLTETRRYTGQVDEAQRSIEVILGAVGRASDMAQQIRQATEQQTQASGQVTDAIREIADSMGSASSEGATVYAAAANLRRMADELRRLDGASANGRHNGHHAGHPA
ncbi:MAG TPA: methyl-accepting chemotaxis protein [Chloroflexia bacterium]|nr:methyl-accepting chemotaxis protein [Chloroflexia bacterium]